MIFGTKGEYLSMWNPFEIFEREKFWREHFENARLKSEHDSHSHSSHDDLCPHCLGAVKQKEMTSEWIELDQ